MTAMVDSDDDDVGDDGSGCGCGIYGKVIEAC